MSLIRERSMFIFKGNNGDNVNKVKPPHTFGCCCGNIMSKKPQENP